MTQIQARAPIATITAAIALAYVGPVGDERPLRPVGVLHDALRALAEIAHVQHHALPAAAITVPHIAARRPPIRGVAILGRHPITAPIPVRAELRGRPRPVMAPPKLP